MKRLTKVAICRKLKELRELMNLSLKDVSKKTSYSINSLYKVERGFFIPSLEKLNKLCRIYGLTVGELFLRIQFPNAAISLRTFIEDNT